MGVDITFTEDDLSRMALQPDFDEVWAALGKAVHAKAVANVADRAAPAPAPSPEVGRGG